MEMESFEWFDVPTFEGRYQVNEYGDIRSINYKKTTKAMILKPRLVRGYKCVEFYFNKKRRSVFNHQAVAIDAINIARGEVYLFGEILSKSKSRISKRKGVTFSKNLNKWGVRFGGLFIGNYRTEEEGISVSEKCEIAINGGMPIKEFKLSLKKPKPQKKVKTNSSEVKGVTYKSTKNIWECYHYEQNKKIYVGSFKSESEAANALHNLKATY